MSADELQIFNISLGIPISYQHFNQGADKPLILFFHGFADSAKALLRRAYPVANEKYEVLAINGPFPVPQKKDGIWKYAFAWYFSDYTTHTTYIHAKTSVRPVNELLSHLNLQNRRKFIVAFSQGAFFVPHLLPTLIGVEHVVTIGAYYRPEDYPDVLGVTVDALHGTKDDVIFVEKSRESFERLKVKNPNGQFVEFDNLGHTMNDETRKWLSQKINQVLR